MFVALLDASSVSLHKQATAVAATEEEYTGEFDLPSQVANFQDTDIKYLNELMDIVVYHFNNGNGYPTIEYDKKEMVIRMKIL